MKKLLTNSSILLTMIITAGVTIALQSAVALVFQSQPVGIQVGDGVIQATQASDNLIYGVLGASGAGSLLLLQNGSGNDRFKVDISGNVTVAGNITAAGQNVCRQDGTYCPTSSTPNLQAVTDVGNTTTQSITVASLNTGLGASELYPMNQYLRTTDNVTFGSVSGSGASLTSLNATNISSGTLSDARLSATVTKLGSTIETSEITQNVVSSIDGVSNDGGNIDLVAGDGITLTPNDGSNNITIAAAGTSYIGNPDDACGTQTVFGKLNCLLGGSYFYVGTYMTWDNAKNYCVSQGGRLANILNETQNQSVKSVIPSGGSAWIGANDISSEGSWSWHNGGSLAYGAWRGGEPNNSGDEDCGNMGQSDGLWNDWGCGNTAPSVCEYY